MLHYASSSSSAISLQDQAERTTRKRSDHMPPPKLISGQHQNPTVNRHTPASKENVATTSIRCLNTHINPHENDNNAELHKTSYAEISAISRRNEGLNTYHVPKDRKVIRKKLSGFFKKTNDPIELSMSEKSILSIRAPVLKMDHSSTDGELDLHFDSVNTSIHGKPSINDGTYTFAESRLDSSSDCEGANLTAKLKKTRRHFHFLGSSPNKDVYIDDTHAHWSPSIDQYLKQAEDPKLGATSSTHDRRASTIGVDDNNAAKDTGERRSKHPNTPKKRSERRLRLGAEQIGDIDEDDFPTPTQKTFDASAYSRHAESVPAAKLVHIASHKAALVDIPARRGDNFPATIDINDPHNRALFSNPPDAKILQYEMEIEAINAQRAQRAMDESMAKYSDDASGSLRAKGSQASLTTDAERRKETRDRHRGKKPDNHKEEHKSNYEEESTNPEARKAERAKQRKDKNVENGTARARMEGY